MSESNKKCPREREQHVHEVLGSVRITGFCDEAHNHRFATVSEVAIPCDGSHVHRIEFRTDSCDGHFHEFSGTSTKAIQVDEDHHVHFLEGMTTSNANHRHRFEVATLIDDPTCE